MSYYMHPEQSYIGSAIRNMHDGLKEVKEHLTRLILSAYKHFINKHNAENMSNNVNIIIVMKKMTRLIYD